MRHIIRHRWYVTYNRTRNPQIGIWVSIICGQKVYEIGLYVHGTCRKQVILRHFNDHADEISSYIDTKQKKNHDVRYFSHIGDKTDSQVHIMIWNSLNSVMFITNFNDVLGKSNETSTSDYRTFSSRPEIVKAYNNDMNSCDVYAQSIHEHNIRYIAIKIN